MKDLASLNPFFWKYRLRLLLGILFIVLSNYFRILAPQLTGYVVNTVVQKADGNSAARTGGQKEYDIIVYRIIKILESKSFGERFLWCGITLLVLAIISGIFMFFMRQTIIVMSRLIEYDQKNQVFSHYQQLDTNFFKTHSTGDLMNRISEDEIGRAHV